MLHDDFHVGIVVGIFVATENHVTVSTECYELMHVGLCLIL